MAKHFEPKKGNLILYIILLIIVVAIMFCLKKLSTKENLSDSDQITLKAAIIHSPLGLDIEDGEIRGLNYRKLSQFTDSEGIRLSITPVTDLDEALKALEKGSIQLIASVPASDSFSKRFLISDNLFHDTLILISSPQFKHPLRSSSLANQSVCISKDSPAKIELQKINRFFSGSVSIKELPHHSDSDIIDSVSAGSIRFAIIEKTALDYHSPVLINIGQTYTQPHVWLINRTDSSLLDKINRFISINKQDSTYE